MAPNMTPALEAMMQAAAGNGEYNGPGDPIIAAQLKQYPTFIPKPLPLPRQASKTTREELLWAAARDGAIEAASELLRKGAKINKPAPVSGWTALHWASASGRSDMARFLVSEGAEIRARANQMSAGGCTPLLLAAQAGHADCCSVLLECGAPADAPDVDLGWSPLVWAAHFGHADACLALLHGGACFEYQAQVKQDPVLRGMNAQQVATAMKHEEAESVLIGWKSTAALKGSKALERQDEKDRSIEMAAEDDRSFQVEAYHKALLAAAEAKRIAERDARLAAEKAQRAYDRDLAILEEFRGKVEERMQQAQDEEDWDLYEEITEELHTMPSTVDEYRAYVAEQARLELEAEQEREAEEGELMASEDLDVPVVETDVVAADDTSASQGVPVATEGKAAIDATATASP